MGDTERDSTRRYEDRRVFHRRKAHRRKKHQFIDVDKRSILIQKIYDGLIPSGVLIISEKIHFDDRENQKQLARLHLDFKRANGYSELEIANKRQSLENILVTESKKAHLERLKICGFKESSCYFQCLNFASFLSVK